MGFQDRDYTRESGSYSGAAGGWGLDYIPPVVKGLIAANVVIFVLQIFAVRPATEADVRAEWKQLMERTREAYRHKLGREIGDEAQPNERDPILQEEDLPPQIWRDLAARSPNICVVDEWLALKPSLVLRGQVWRLLTYSFCHDRDEIWHIFFNMLALFWFGMTLESMYGGREFLLFYLAAAVFAGLTNLGLDLALALLFVILLRYAMQWPDFWFLAAGAVLILAGFLVSYPRMQERQLQRAVERMYDEGRNLLIYGPRRIGLTPHFLNNSSPFFQSVTRWVAVEKIVVAEDALYIYISSVSSVVIPRRAFSSDDHFQTFVHTAQEYHTRALAAENPQQVLPRAIP